MAFRLTTVLTIALFCAIAHCATAETFQQIVHREAASQEHSVEAVVRQSKCEKQILACEKKCDKLTKGVNKCKKDCAKLCEIVVPTTPEPVPLSKCEQKILNCEKRCDKVGKGVKKCKRACNKLCVPPSPSPPPCKIVFAKLPNRKTRFTCVCPEKKFKSEYTAAKENLVCVRECVSKSERLVEACDARKFFMEFRSVVNACCQSKCKGIFAFFEDRCDAKMKKK